MKHWVSRSRAASGRVGQAPEGIVVDPGLQLRFLGIGGTDHSPDQIGDALVGGLGIEAVRNVAVKIPAETDGTSEAWETWSSRNRFMDGDR